MPPEYVTWIETFVCWTSCDIKRGKKKQKIVCHFLFKLLPSNLHYLTDRQSYDCSNSPFLSSNVYVNR